jgi:hypothetical protein
MIHRILHIIPLIRVRSGWFGFCSPSFGSVRDRSGRFGIVRVGSGSFGLRSPSVRVSFAFVSHVVLTGYGCISTFVRVN